MASLSELPAPVIIKSDRLGRLFYSPQYKADVLAAFDESSMSGASFAGRCGINYTTFASWLAKRRCEENSARSGTNTDTGQRFVLAEFPCEISSSTSPDEPVLEVRLPGGSLVTVSNVAQMPLLAGLLKALA